MNNWHLGRRIRRLLEFSGYGQLLWSLAGTLGISGVVVAVVGWVLSPLNGWEIALLVSLFFAVMPVTLPVSAALLNVGLSQAEKSRKREILDSPTQRARKALDEVIADASRRMESVPDTFGTPAEADYNIQRYFHWFRDTDATVLRVAGRWAGSCFSVNDHPEAWRSRGPEDASYIRQRYSKDIRVLELIRDEFPIDRKKWLKRSASIDIENGRTLLAYLRSGSEDDFGQAEVERWAVGAYNAMHRDGMEGAHLFAPETREDVSTLAERISYVESRVETLDELWRNL